MRIGHIIYTTQEVAGLDNFGNPVELKTAGVLLVVVGQGENGSILAELLDHKNELGQFEVHPGTFHRLRDTRFIDVLTKEYNLKVGELLPNPNKPALPEPDEGQFVDYEEEEGEEPLVDEGYDEFEGDIPDDLLDEEEDK